ncbi:MAG: DUF3352 domain-containing protein [Bacteroidota bacterium]
MTKRRIRTVLLTLLLIYLGYLAYIFILSPKTNLQSIYLIPKNAVFIIESERPVESWRTVSESHAWQHLKQNDYFDELTQNIQKVDTIFKDQRRLFEFFDGRSLFISIHMTTPNDYGIFYVLDLKRIAKLNLLKTYLNTLLNDNYSLSKRRYHGHEILEVYDRKNKETMHLAFIKNQLVASYTHSLVEASIDQYLEPKIGRDLGFIEINERVGYEDLFRVYVQYEYIEDYLNRFFHRPDDWVGRISKNFMFSGFHLDLDNKGTLKANGFTNTRLTHEAYLEALQKSGTSKRTIPTIAPKQTALYVSYGFDSFFEFYGNFETLQQSNDAEQYKSYRKGIEKVEKILKIDIKKNFIVWVGDEIALLQIQSSMAEGKNDLALVLKTRDITDAKTHLDFILRQIKKKTPVKFKTITYKEHDINFLSIKGFFKVVLGNRFQEFDKPYFTIIDKYVVFSDNPNTLKSMITAVVDGETLAKSEDFQHFDDKFERTSSLYVYSNVPMLYKSMYAMADGKVKSQLRTNRDFIICFPQIGFQLTSEGDLFESRLVVAYEDVDAVKAKLRSNETSKITGATGQSLKNNINIETIFELPPIYPSDLNAKSFTKRYASGQTKYVVELKDGQKHGRYTEYYLDGTEKITGRFRKDEQIGTWRYFDKVGEQQFKKRF